MLLSRDDIDRMAERLFQARVRDALVRFPAYAEEVKRHCGGLPKVGDPLKPSDLPVWSKVFQKDLFQTLKTAPVKGAYIHATGGSTGVPTRFYITRESYEWRSAVADRGYSWAGAEEGVRSYFIWSTPATTPPRIALMKQALHRRLLGRRLFSLFAFGDERKALCCREINRFRPTAIVGYSGNLLELAQYVQSHPGILTWRPHSIVGGAEGLPPGGRQVIETHLGGEVFMSYGSREFMLIGMECRFHSGYHISADNVMVEVVDDTGKPLPAGKCGRILVTDLRNEAAPLIRYDIGDIGALAPDEPCPCGCSFPRLERVEGRCGEYVELPDGSRLTAIFIAHTLKEFVWIQGFQIAQTNKNAITVRVITRDFLASHAEAEMLGQLRKSMGFAIEINIVRVDKLEKTPSGKTPPVVRT